MPNDLPKDSQIIALILKSMGVDSCEPGVIPQLLEFIYHYSVEVIGDSQLYAEHSGRNSIQVEDVRLAIQNKINHSFTPPPPRELLMEMASKKNAQPLPVIPESFGINLPNERHCLLSLNYQVVPPSVTMSSSIPGPTTSVTGSVNVSSSSRLPSTSMMDFSGVSNLNSNNNAFMKNDDDYDDDVDMEQG